MIKRNEQGILIVVSGPSGCGKSTVDNLLIKKRKNIIMSVSDTTRPPRNGEVNGKDYNFITAKEFENNIKNFHISWYGSFYCKIFKRSYFFMWIYIL